MARPVGEAEQTTPAGHVARVLIPKAAMLHSHGTDKQGLMAAHGSWAVWASHPEQSGTPGGSQVAEKTASYANVQL